MMAYIKELEQPCQSGRFCKKRAVIEVFHWRNHSLGVYCRKCGQAKLAEAKKRESKELD